MEKKTICSQAISKYVRISPYKLRPLADMVRNNEVGRALFLLKSSAMKRVIPLAKTIYSAYCNAKQKCSDKNVADQSFVLKQIRIEEGPIIRYFKPGAMGRSCVQRKRLSHIIAVVEKVD